MILAVDVGGDRKSYGFQLVINSLNAKVNNLVTYISNSDLHKVNINDYRVVLMSFMFVTNYLYVAKAFKRLKLELYANQRPNIVVIAGGQPISENPEPVAEFFDICVIGEAEWVILDIVQSLYSQDKTSALEEIYNTVSCAYVPKYYYPKYNDSEKTINKDGRVVKIQREHPDKTIGIPGFYTRECKAVSKSLEYSTEYHRGCKRKCSFCSYSYLQGQYRVISQENFDRNIRDITRHDKGNNKIIPIQTNLFHYRESDIDMMRTINRFPNYSSACLADCFAPRGQRILQRFQKTSIYLRFGVEDFTEQGRSQLKKPILNRMISCLPMLFPGKGNHFKFFFITSLPGQNTHDVKEFENTLRDFSNNISRFYCIDIFFTVLNYKLSTPIALHGKKYNHDITDYIKHKLPRKIGKLTIKAFKNQSENAWLEANILSLVNRKITPILAQNTKHNREQFLQRCREVINFDAIFSAYNNSDTLPNWFIDYTEEK